LAELQSLSAEQRAARAAQELLRKRKDDAFLLVKKDDAESLRELLTNIGPDVAWQDWRDYMGRTLQRFASELRASAAKDCLMQVREKQERQRKQQEALGATDEQEEEEEEPADAGTGGSGEVRPGPCYFEVRQGSREGNHSGPLPPVLGSAVVEASPPSAVIVPSMAVAGAGREQSSSPRYSKGAPFDLYADDWATQPPLPQASEAVSGKPLTTPAGDGAVSAALPEVPKIEADISETEEAELKAKAFRSVVQDDVGSLGEVLERLPLGVWSQWQNKAGKDLLTLSQERGSSGAYSVLAKALGMVQEMKRESFEERESVWIFVPGEIQPLRATVLEDTPAEKDTVLVEYWDGDAPASAVERCMVRKMWA
jgi:hypothetical protein